MKHLPAMSLLATLALGLAAGAAAHAQPSAAPAAVPPADDGDDVSELKGQLVPVGDENRYRHSYKRINISTNPLGLIYGSYGLSASYAFHKQIAVRGDVGIWAPVEGNDHGFDLGVSAPIYFRKMYSGPYLEPGLTSKTRVYEYDYTYANGDSGSRTTTILGPQVLVGYHWYWDSGLNVSVAAGIGRNWNTDSRADDYYDEKLFPNGYLRFGYAF